MRLGIVSDSHGHLKQTLSAVRMLESLEVQRVLHCGDIGTEEIVELFVPWPTDFVFGNCDYHRAELEAAIAAAGLTCHGVFGELTIEGKRIALLHSDDRHRFREVTQTGDWDLVCYGHTHQSAIDRHGPTLIVNPGAMVRADPPSIAVIELPSLEATIVEL